MAFCNKYKIAPNELLLFQILLLTQEGDDSELIKDYFYLDVCSRGSIIDMLTKLQLAGLVNKSFKIPKAGSSIDPYTIPLNKNVVKDYYKGAFELGIELWETYPQFGLVNNVTVGLRTISDKDDSIEDFYRRYGKEIGWNPEKHQEILELVKWAKENNIINYAISKFVRNHKWEELEALKNGDNGANVNYNSIKLL